jgi:hypothetical protein
MIAIPILFLVVLTIMAVNGIATSKPSKRNPYTGRYE